MSIIKICFIISFILLFSEYTICQEKDEYHKKLLSVPKEIKLQCVFELEKLEKDDSLSKRIRDLFLDSLKDWKNKKLKYTNYQNSSFEFIPNIVCFNSSRDKGLIFILQIDKSKKGDYSIRFNLCVKENNEWGFYTYNIADYFLQKSKLIKDYPKAKKIKINGVNFGYLIALFYDMLAVNYFLDSDCTINDYFINGFYRDDTKEMHEEFFKQ